MNSFLSNTLTDNPSTQKHEGQRLSYRIKKCRQLTHALKVLFKKFKFLVYFVKTYVQDHLYTSL